MPIAIVRHGPGFLEKSVEPVRGDASRLPWAWDGLCFGVPFNDPTRDSARDLATGVPPNEWAGTLSWVRDDRGNAAASLGDAAYLGYADNPRHDRPSTALTVYLRYRRAASGPAGVGFFGKVHTPGLSPWNTWAVQTADSDATKLSALITITDNWYYWESTSYVIDTATWVSVFLRWTSGSAPVQDILGERGQTYSSVSYGSALSGTLWYGTAQPIRINASDVPPPTGPSCRGDYSQAMVWNRRLTNTELQALVSDPFGWYAPRRETVVVAGAFPFVPGAGEMRMTGVSGGGMM